MTFTLVPVGGTYLDEAVPPVPRTGTVRLELLGPLLNDGVTADCQPVEAVLDAAGTATFEVRATNDPGTLPAGGGAYRVTETLEGLPTAVYVIAVPFDGGPVDLLTAPRLEGEAVPFPATVFQPVNERGLPGGYAPLDGGGRVSLEHLPPDLGGGEGGGGVVLSGQATDIKDLGTRAAGASGLAADASHVHRMHRLDQVMPPTAPVAMNGQKLTGLAAGEGPQDAATVAQLGESGLDWLNVRTATYGATGDGVTDDTVALQAALDACPPGGIVYLPAGHYRTSAPLIIPPAVTLQGTHSNMMSAVGLTDPPCYIQPLPAFAGQSVLLLVDQATGGYPALSSEQRIYNIMIDGSELVASCDGIYAAGNIQNVVMREITLRKLTNNGIVTGVVGNVFPWSWRLHSVMADNCHGSGFVFTVMTDLTMIDCQAIGCWADGYILDRISNGQLVGCRSEWNGNHGYHLTGNWGNDTGSGGAVFSGCATDRNGWDGVHIDATGNTPVTLSGMMTRRDGRNGGSGGGGYAGLAVAGATLPVIADGLTCYPGTDDDGTGASSPQYGAYLAGACQVQLTSGYLHAAQSGLLDASSGGQVTFGRGLTLASGSTAAPVRTRPYTQPTGPTVEDLFADTPFFIAHRGGGAEADEHTMAAYEAAVAGGATAIEVSVNVTADGRLVCIHDQSLDRTTDGTGPVIDWTYQALRQTVRTTPKELLGDGWEPQVLSSLREVLDRFLGRVVIFLEPKANESIVPLQDFLTEHYPHAHRSVVIKGYYTASNFPWALARGFKTWGYVDPETTQAAMDLKDANISYWGVPSAMSDANMQAVALRGKPVICWEVHRRSDVTRLLANGVQGMMCAEPTYVQGTGQLGPADDWATSVKAPGDMGTTGYNASRALKYTGDGWAHLEDVGAAALIGSRSLGSFPPNGYRIEFDMRYDTIPGGTEHAGIAFGKVADDKYQFNLLNASGGYHVLVRANAGGSHASGDIQLYKHAPGVASGTELGRLVTEAITAGQAMTLQIDVTPTQVILRRTDVGPYELAINNTDYRGTYLHLSWNSLPLASMPHWRGLSVTAL